MKKISVALVLILLIFQSSTAITASAETNASFSVVSAYYKSGNIYSFLTAENSDDVMYKRFSIVKDDIVADYDSYPYKLTSSDTVINYMLLIDASTSMVSYKDQMATFAKALIDNEKNDINLSIAVFGERFSVVRENITDINGVTSTLNGLKYNHDATDISGGLTDALEYMSNQTVEDGELSGIILLTDGIPFLSNNGNDQSRLSSDAQKLKNKIVETPEIIVHSVAFNEWDPITYSGVSTGTGLHTSVSTAYGAAAAGKKISEFIDSIYRVDFPYSMSQYTGRSNLKIIRIEGSKIVPVENIRNYDKVDLVKPSLGNGNSDSDEETIQVTESTENVEESTAETVSETTEAIDVTESESTDAAAIIGEEKSNGDGNNILLFIIIGVVALLIIVIVAIIITKSKKSKKSKNSGEKNARISRNSIFMKAEIISGNCKTANTELQLRKELIFGSDPSCNLVFDDYSIAPKNTRIYINEGIIYIEDLNLQSNTYLEGMKIHTPNRLRSGDEISMGSVSIKLRF